MNKGCAFSTELNRAPLEWRETQTQFRCINRTFAHFNEAIINTSYLLKIGCKKTGNIAIERMYVTALTRRP